MKRGDVMYRNHATGDKIVHCGCIWVYVHVCEVVAYAVVAEVILWSTPTTLLPDSKVHEANMGPIWGRQDPGEPHVGPMNFAIRAVHQVILSTNGPCQNWSFWIKYPASLENSGILFIWNNTIYSIKLCFISASQEHLIRLTNSYINRYAYVYICKYIYIYKHLELV